jgi:hypothetical protein
MTRGLGLDPRAVAREGLAMSHPTLDSTILDLCMDAGPSRTICPTDAARAFSAARGDDALAWRSHLTEVRRRAVALAQDGRIVIYRKGKPIDPAETRGVIRLGLPRHD